MLQLCVVAPPPPTDLPPHPSPRPLDEARALPLLTELPLQRRLGGDKALHLCLQCFLPLQQLLLFCQQRLNLQQQH